MFRKLEETYRVITPEGSDITTEFLLSSIINVHTAYRTHPKSCKAVGKSMKYTTNLCVNKVRRNKYIAFRSPVSQILDQELTITCFVQREDLRRERMNFYRLFVIQIT